MDTKPWARVMTSFCQFPGRVQMWAIWTGLSDSSLLSSHQTDTAKEWSQKFCTGTALPKEGGRFRFSGEGLKGIQFTIYCGF